MNSAGRAATPSGKTCPAKLAFLSSQPRDTARLQAGGRTSRPRTHLIGWAGGRAVSAPAVQWAHTGGEYSVIHGSTGDLGCIRHQRLSLEANRVWRSRWRYQLPVHLAASRDTRLPGIAFDGDTGRLSTPSVPIQRRYLASEHGNERTETRCNDAVLRHGSSASDLTPHTQRDDTRGHNKSVPHAPSRPAPPRRCKRTRRACRPPPLGRCGSRTPPPRLPAPGRRSPACTRRLSSNRSSMVCSVSPANKGESACWRAVSVLMQMARLPFRAG